MVYIVILNWNGWQDTLACLESVYQLNPDAYQVVVCDNGSEDGSINHIQEWFERNKPTQIGSCYCIDAMQVEGDSPATSGDLVVVKSEQNLGYAGGNNLAMRYCLNQDDMTHIWLLNNDTEVTADSLTSQLALSRKNADLSIIGSKLVYFDDRNTLQGVGGRYQYWLGHSQHVLAHCPVKTELTKQAVDYPIGASMLFPRACLEQVGLLCEDYFLYYEELDYVNRAKQKGFFVDIATESVVYHKEGASIQKSVLSDFYFVRNKFIIAYKFTPVTLISLCCLLPLWSINRLRRRDYVKALNCFKAFGSFVKWAVRKSES